MRSSGASLARQLDDGLGGGDRGGVEKGSSAGHALAADQPDLEPPSTRAARHQRDQPFGREVDMRDFLAGRVKHLACLQRHPLELVLECAHAGLGQRIEQAVAESSAPLAVNCADAAEVGQRCPEDTLVDRLGE